jgi:hypothetical protein
MRKLRKKIRQLRARFGNGGTIRKHEPQPLRDWLILLAGWSVVLVMLLGYGLYRYGAMGATSESAPPQNAIGRFDRSLLQSTVKTYRGRAIRLERLRTVPDAAPDPGFVHKQGTSTTETSVVLEETPEPRQ